MKFNDMYGTIFNKVMTIEANFELNLLYLDNYVLAYDNRDSLLKDYTEAIRNFPKADVVIHTTKQKIKGMWRDED